MTATRVAAFIGDKNETQVAKFIGEMTRDLAKLARAHKLCTLGYILDIARLAADDRAAEEPELAAANRG